jgi:hypothetical protein
MRIREIITENTVTPDLALRKLSIAGNDLKGVISTANKDLESAVKNGWTEQLLPILGTVSRWFIENYVSSRRSGTHNIQYMLGVLRNQKAFKDAASIAYDGIELHADKSNRESTIKSTEKLVNAIHEIVAKAEKTNFKDSLGPNAKLRTDNLVTEYRRMKQLMAELSASGKQDSDQINDPAVAARRAATKDTQKTVGTQSSQANEIVQQIIATLPKEHQHALRQSVAKSDNKLAALNVAMRRLGLA